MTEIHELDLDLDDRVPMYPDVPYMAEGLIASSIKYDRHKDEDFLIATDWDHQCQSHHDWSKVPEGADPSYVCWNCDAVKFPADVLVEDDLDE